jgi:hypothetical protein
VVPVVSIDDLAEAKVNHEHDVSERLTSAARATLADDIGRIVAIVAQLFSAIERHTHLIEEELVIACGEQARPFAQSTLQDRLTTCANGLDVSLQKIALNLKQRAAAGGS